MVSGSCKNILKFDLTEMKYKIGNELLMLIDKLSIKVMSQGISQLVPQGTRDQNETEPILFF